MKGFNYQNQTYTVTMQSSSICSDSETSTISQCSFIGQPMQQTQKQQLKQQQSNDTTLNSTFTIENQRRQHFDQDSEYYNEEELWRMMDIDEYDNSIDQSNRPSYLDLAGNSGCTPIVSRKPRFQFSSMYQIHVNSDYLDESQNLKKNIYYGFIFK